MHVVSLLVPMDSLYVQEMDRANSGFGVGKHPKIIGQLMRMMGFALMLNGIQLKDHRS